MRRILTNLIEFLILSLAICTGILLAVWILVEGLK